MTDTMAEPFYQIDPIADFRQRETAQFPTEKTDDKQVVLTKKVLNGSDTHTPLVQEGVIAIEAFFQVYNPEGFPRLDQHKININTLNKDEQLEEIISSDNETRNFLIQHDFIEDMNRTLNKICTRFKKVNKIQIEYCPAPDENLCDLLNIRISCPLERREFNKLSEKVFLSLKAHTKKQFRAMLSITRL